MLTMLLVVLPIIQADTDSIIDRFDLFHRCEPMNLLVEGLPDDAVEIDLFRSRIETLAESRLRAARLYDADASPYLYVKVGVLVSERSSGAFTVDVAYKKTVYDSESDWWGYAQTWNAGSYGTHGGDAGYIMQSVSERLDQFILEYLRVNEGACDG